MADGVRFVHPVPENVVCAVCRDVMRDPVSSCDPGHFFCLACVDREEVTCCPLCRGVYNKRRSFKWRRSIPVQDQIQTLTVLCKHGPDDGGLVGPEAGDNNPLQCPWRGPLSELQRHLNTNCLFQPIPCQFSANGCQVIVTRQLMAKHEEECVYRPQPCSGCKQVFHGGDLQDHIVECEEVIVKCSLCNAEIVRKNMQGHMHDDCPEAEIVCEFAEVGCKEKMKRKDASKHASENAVRHISLVARTENPEKSHMKEDRENIDRMKEELDQLKEAVKEAEQLKEESLKGIKEEVDQLKGEVKMMKGVKAQVDRLKTDVNSMKGMQEELDEVAELAEEVKKKLKREQAVVVELKEKLQREKQARIKTRKIVDVLQEEKEAMEEWIKQLESKVQQLREAHGAHIHWTLTADEVRSQLPSPPAEGASNIYSKWHADRDGVKWQLRLGVCKKHPEHVGVYVQPDRVPAQKKSYSISLKRPIQTSCQGHQQWENTNGWGRHEFVRYADLVASQDNEFEAKVYDYVDDDSSESEESGSE